MNNKANKANKAFNKAKLPQPFTHSDEKMTDVIVKRFKKTQENKLIVSSLERPNEIETKETPINTELSLNINGHTSETNLGVTSLATDYSAETSETFLKKELMKINENLDNKEPLKLVGRTFIAPRHFPAAIKEWKNSVYVYNKMTLNHLPSIDIVTTSFIKSYFYLTHITNKPRSRRMRSLRRKYTSKKIFSSKPEVKQTSDKVIVTLYTFNREKQFLLKKLFYYDRRAALYLVWKKTNELDNIHKTGLTNVRLEYIQKSKQFLYFLKQRNSKQLLEEFIVKNADNGQKELKNAQVWKDFYDSTYFKVMLKYIIRYVLKKYEETNQNLSTTNKIKDDISNTGRLKKIRVLRNILKNGFLAYNRKKDRALLHSQLASVPGLSAVKALYPKNLQDFYCHLSEIMRTNDKQATKLTKLILEHQSPRNIVHGLINSPKKPTSSVERSALLNLKLKSALYQSKKAGRSKKHLFVSLPKVNRYYRRFYLSYKKIAAPAVKPWYTRKKMKRVKAVPVFVGKINKSKYDRRKVAYSGLKLKSQMNFLSFKLLLKYKKYAYARKLFYYYFLKYVLSIFNIKFYAFKENDVPSFDYMHRLIRANVLRRTEKTIKVSRKGKRNKKSKFIYDIDKSEIPYYRPINTLTSKGDKMFLHFYIIKTKDNILNKIILKKTNKHNLDFLNRTKPFVISFNLIPNIDNKSNLDYILSNVNYIVEKFISNIFTKCLSLEKERILPFILKRYKKRHYFKYISRFWKKEALFKSTYINFMVNKFKFNKYLPTLKLFLSKIYNKKIELNIINLKYASLNTDIFTDVIALKLRKRLGLLRVMKKAMMLAKLPKAYLDQSKVKNPIRLNLLLNYSNLNLKRVLDKNPNIFTVFDMGDITYALYPYPLDITPCCNTKALVKTAATGSVTSKLQNVLSKIKYKSISGLWIEGAGRITRRYSAARAIHKVKHKGSLKDNDYFRKIELSILRKSPSKVFLRNKAKANSQYSTVMSKRRIGAFGIKGWISGY